VPDHPALRVAQKAKRAIRFQTARPAVLAGSESSSSRWKGVVDVFDLEGNVKSTRVDQQERQAKRHCSSRRCAVSITETSTLTS